MSPSVGEATTSEQAIRLAVTHHPNVVLTSSAIGDGSAAPVLEALRRGPCSTSTLGAFATRLDSPEELAAFANLHIAGYCTWHDVPYAVLRLCLLALLTGDVFLSSRTPVQAFTSILLGRAEPAPALSTRERAVLQGLAAGLSQKEIAQCLGYGERTVRRVIAELEEKLAAPTPFVLGMKAARLGIIR